MKRFVLLVWLLSFATGLSQLVPVSKHKTRKAPLFSALAPDQSRLYVTCFASDEIVGFDKGVRDFSVRFYGGYEPQGIALTPVGDKIFVTNRRGLVKVIDSRTYKILDDIKVGGVPSNVTMSQNGLLAFITNYGRGKIGRVDFLDTSSHRILGEVELGVRPISAAVSPLGDQLFVACAGSGEIYVINTSNRKVIKNIPVGLGPSGMAFSPDGSTMYVTNSGTNDLSIIDTLDLKELRRASVGNSPFSIAVDSAGRLLVVETGDSALSLYSPEFNRITSVKAGKKPIHVTLSLEDNLAYVTDEKDNRLLVFQLK